METKKESRVKVPDAGFVSKIARDIGCSRATVWNALRKNSKGIKAEKVRQAYQVMMGKETKIL